MIPTTPRRSSNNEAKAQGLYKDGEPVVLELRSAGQTASEMFNGTAEMFNKNIADAIKKCPAGTTFSSVTLKVGTSSSEAEYSAAVKKGEMDISFSGWGGATFNPWGVIYGSYIDPANSNNFGFDTSRKATRILPKAFTTGRAGSTTIRTIPITTAARRTISIKSWAE